MWRAVFFSTTTGIKAGKESTSTSCLFAKIRLVECCLIFDGAVSWDSVILESLQFWTSPLLPCKTGVYRTCQGWVWTSLLRIKLSFKQCWFFLRGVFSWCNLVLCIISIVSVFIKINFQLIASVALWDSSNYESFASRSGQWGFTVCVYICLFPKTTGKVICTVDQLTILLI